MHGQTLQSQSQSYPYPHPVPRTHHPPPCRYIFEEKSKKASSSKKEGPQKVVQARLQELGPRFTLKLQSLQKGTFDSKHGEFEWVHKRKEMDTSRRKFHL
jgi:ribosome production factor 1